MSEQIENRLKRLKSNKQLTKEDLVKPRMNEDNLYKKQLQYVYKVGKRLEALSYREDIEENEEMYEEVKQAMQKNDQRKKRLLDEGKPNIDYDYLRLL